VRRRRAFSIVEIILALALLIVTGFAMLSFFTQSGKHAVHTRHRKLALVTAQNLLEEVRAHPYGEPAPKTWPLDPQNPLTESYLFVLAGNRQAEDFKKSMTFQNGSLIGKTQDDFDEVTVKVTWEDQGDPERQEVSATAQVCRPSLAK
jgi:type II secretory pathway pseudopilin PulG